MPSTPITQFRGKHAFLSNFYESPIHVTNIGITPKFVAPTAEHLFQAMKSRDPNEQYHVLISPSPGVAKRIGRTIKLRDDWDDIKLNVMRMIIHAKFEQNPHLAKMLIATGDAHISEGNYWNDTFWGVDLKTGKGENHLGLILMSERTTLQE